MYSPEECTAFAEVLKLYMFELFIARPADCNGFEDFLDKFTSFAYGVLWFRADGEDPIEALG